jgi:hypothetical protein
LFWTLQKGKEGFAKRIKSIFLVHMKHSSMRYKLMYNAAVNDGLNVQIDVYPAALLCASNYANPKLPEIVKNAWNWGNSYVLTPNTLNAWSNNYGKLTFKRINEIGKPLRIKMSHICSAEWKTILFPNTPLSLSIHCHHCGRRGL